MEEKMCFKTIILTYIKNGKEQVSQASYYHLHTTRMIKEWLNTLYSTFTCIYMRSCPWFSGCVSTGVTRHGGDIATIKNVSHYTDCNKLCSENEDCFIWTYIEGACYIKTENTFWVRHEHSTGGYKYCNSHERKGKLEI